MPDAPRIAFFGPTLPRRPDSRWETLLSGWEVRPPAQRGDLLAAVAKRPETILLVDGYYYTVPAVTHKEILYALDAGVRVLGAASLGALRAAELAAFGMTGVGAIFEQYRDGALDGDDEVALLHAPEEYGYRPITLALVEVRDAVARLPVESGPFVAAVKALPFTERYPGKIFELARRHLGEAAARNLAELLASRSLKQEDALRALETAAVPASPTAPRPWNATGYLSFFKEMYLPGPVSGSLVLQAWRMAQLIHPAAPCFMHKIRRRSLLVEVANREGLVPRPRREAEIARGLTDRHDRPFLPPPEYAEEAHLLALAEEACAAFGGASEAVQSLVQRFGLPDGTAGEERLLRMAIHQDAIPGWWLARAFSFTPAFRPAVEAAVAAGEVDRCFRRRAEGARILREDLWRLAGEIWQCAPDRVEEEAAQRGLFPAQGPSEGLREAFERVAAAERLPVPINDYREARARLAGAPLLESM